MKKIVAIQITAETKQAQANLKDINNVLQEQEDILDEIQREIVKVEKKQSETSGKELARLKKHNDKLKELNNTRKIQTNKIKETKNAQKEANVILKDATKQNRDFGGVLGVVDKQTGGLISGLQGTMKSLTGATKGFKLMTAAIISTGIGALVLGILALVQSFKRSEAGQEKFQRGMAVIGAVVNQVLDLFAGLGESIVEAFTSPMKSIKSFFTGIKNFVLSPIESTKKAFNDAKESAIDFIAETTKEMLVLDKVTKARQKAHHIERDLQVERAEANRKINDIRLKAEDRETQTAAQRIKLLREAQQIEEDITAKEIKAQQILVDAQILEMEQGLNTIEAKDKLAKMQAKLINLDTKKLRSQRLLQTQITTALNEEKAAKEKAAAEAQKKIDDDKTAADKIIQDAADLEQKRLDGIKAIQDAFKAAEAERNAITEEEKAILDKEKAIAALDELNANEEQKTNIIKYWDSQIMNAKVLDQKNNQKILDAKLSAQLNYAAAIGGSLNALGSLFEQGTAAAKAAALAEIIIKTGIGYVQGLDIAQKSAAGTGPAAAFAFPIFYAQQIGAVIGAVSQAKNILSQVKGGGPSASVGAGAALAQATPTIQEAPPTFNTVGASETNQLATAIGQQESTPVQAFVVSNDITTAQSLERNIVDGATI
tara:strand:+ start:774 stop:2747 length:1974 start_codon:yes stop_codon:yes gene_type:complete